ncbi:hypothetical protein C8Q73DRAFT_703311 [Cubamyces lactineus]|nr:hypothetical protein C8Q73DRAFT_703311 [Cubamyces lactineus]
MRISTCTTAESDILALRPQHGYPCIPLSLRTCLYELPNRYCVTDSSPDTRFRAQTISLPTLAMSDEREAGGMARCVPRCTVYRSLWNHSS